MYYSAGNYEALARPSKVENTNVGEVYIVGAGLASLSTASFLIRDGKVDGKKIHILEELNILGGALDGIKNDKKGYVIRGGREMENHFECLWDLYSSIPSIETKGLSVLDEFYALDKKDPNYSKMRVTKNGGKDAGYNFKFMLSDKAILEITKLTVTPDEELFDRRINEIFTDEVFKSPFWLYWRTMFAFENWHSALELKRYWLRFMHHIDGLPDFSALKFTKYNQYESLVLPQLEFLKSHGVNFELNTIVKNVLFDVNKHRKVATKIVGIQNGKDFEIELTENDLVFITNGSCTENSALGDNNTAPELKINGGACWEMWKKIAKQSNDFGNPEKFCGDAEQTKWESATATVTNPKVIKRLSEICKRDIFTGKVVTGGIITCEDSSWLLSYTVSRQPHFKGQPKGTMITWIYGLFPEAIGDFIKKPMEECTGLELAQEWLYHMGFSAEEIPSIVKDGVNCVPCMMPYITAFFMPRNNTDRPKVVPKGSVNFAFIGQFAETPRDTIFTTEYSVRTAMEAVYTLLGVERGVPEVFGSAFDYRYLLKAAVKLHDGKPLTDIHQPKLVKLIEKYTLNKMPANDIKLLLKKYGAI